MKIRVHEIPPQGINLEETKTGQELDLENEELKYILPVHLQAEVNRSLNSLDIKMRVSSRVRYVCGRCLESFEEDLDREFSSVLPVKGVNEIDLTQIAREEIILNYRVRNLCRKACKGLCPVCGRNLNREKCYCQRESVAKKKLPL